VDGEDEIGKMSSRYSFRKGSIRARSHDTVYLCIDNLFAPKSYYVKKHI